MSMKINNDNQEYSQVLDACGKLPRAKGVYLEDDFVMNLMSTVLDYQMQRTTLANAESFFRANRWAGIRTCEDLREALSRYPDTVDGNRAAARYLWGYNYGTRLKQLRGLAAYFDSTGVRDQEALRDWAIKADFEHDFKGKVKGLGFAIYKWLIMRQGVATIKPDIHVKRYLHSIIGRAVADREAVSLLEAVAHALGVPANELDWSIWEHQRGQS